MESSSTGHWSDYPASYKRNKRGGGEGVSGGGTGIPVTEDICQRSIENVSLEDVGRCEYFRTRQTVPPQRHPIEVVPTVVNGRIAVRSIEYNFVIGYLPTRFNYLRKCHEQGFTYRGQVVASSNTPTQRVDVHLLPHHA